MTTPIAIVFAFLAICLIGSALTSALSFTLTVLTITGCGVYFWKTA